MSEDFTQHAKELAKDAVKLVAQIIEKHDAAILEEMHSQLKARDAEIKKLKQVLETAIVWQTREFGDHAVRQSLDELNKELLPCPFCGSGNIREGEMMFCEDEGEQPGVECIDCDALSRREYWNRRVCLTGNTGGNAQ